MLLRSLLTLLAAATLGCGSSAPTGPSAAEGFSSQQKVSKDAAEALVEYVKYSSVTRRGNLVVVEGRIGHEKFGKMLKQVNNSLRPGGGFGGPGGGMPGIPGGGGGPPGRP